MLMPRMAARTRFLVSAIAVWIGISACGGHGSPNQPTQDAPTIACPVAPDPVVSVDGSAQVVSFGAPTVTAGQLPLTTSCIPVSGAAFTVGTTTVTCTTSDAKARTASCTFNVVVQPPPKLSVTSFLAFGDSITEGEDGQNTAALANPHIFVQLPFAERYPSVLLAELQARYQLQTPNVVNDGYTGESLSGGLSSSCDGGPLEQSGAFMRYARDVSANQATGLLLMEGSNDVDDAYNCDGGLNDSCLVPKAVAVLRRIIDDAKSHGIRVVLATIPPMIPPGANCRAKGSSGVSGFNDLVRSLAASENVPLADVYQAFGSDASTLIGFDGLHPNPDGYKRIADTFFGAIKSSLETSNTTSRARRVR